MNTEQRYLYQGHAVAAEWCDRTGEAPRGWIKGAMALPVTGGYGEIRLQRDDCPGEGDPSGVSFEGAAAFVSGDSDGRAEDARGRAYGRVSAEAAAYVTSLNVSGRLQIGQLRSHLEMKDSGHGQPHISFGTKNLMTGEDGWIDPIVDLRVDDAAVIIEYNQAVLHSSTLYELEERLRDRCGVEWYGGSIATSIVSNLRWADQRRGRAQIELPNRIVVEGFGTVYLGELLVKSRRRQLTLVRIRKGADGRDNDSFADTSVNGEGWPQT